MGTPTGSWVDEPDRFHRTKRQCVPPSSSHFFDREAPFEIERCLEGVKRHKNARIGLVVVDGKWPDDGIPRAKDPIAAIRALLIPDAPLFLEFNDGKLSRN